MATSAKPRQPRLRASCDGCFIAKVKCSKARPMCSRCLACGIECRYSPSSRSGKPKSDTCMTHNSGLADLAGLSPMSDDKGVMFAPAMGSLYTIDTSGWTTPPTSVDGGMSRSHSMSSGLSMPSVETSGSGPAEAMNAGDLYGAGLPWTPPHDVPPQYGEPPVMALPFAPSHGRSSSYDISMTAMGPWMDPATQEMLVFAAPNQGGMPAPANHLASTYFPSPSATPNLGPTSRNKCISTSPSGSSVGSCICFTACLQSLQALHNASAPANPPFDLVLSLNRKAVEGCASMLNCARCMSRSGTHTAVMLLATVMGKIISFYRIASHVYFDSGVITNPVSPNASGLGISLGAYHVNGEDGRWLELEILARELRKLEEVYARFTEVCADLSENTCVSKAMIGYLGQTLGSTLEVIHHRKGDANVTFA